MKIDLFSKNDFGFAVSSLLRLMLIKRPFSVALIMLLSLVAGCAAQKAMIGGTVTGTIYVIGNEPFTSLAIEDSGGKIYRLS